MAPGTLAVLQTSEMTATVNEWGWLEPVTAFGQRTLDAVYMSIRDQHWNTIPAQLDQVRVAADLVEFRARHSIGLRWHGRIQATDTALTYSMRAIAERSFAANRIGFCLLHPIEFAGTAVEVETTQGRVSSAFPSSIAAKQPFTDILGLSYSVTPGSRFVIDLDGALFEMEDHRNWTDPGFKTYCTPLREPYPVRHKAGDRIEQAVTLRVEGRPTSVGQRPASRTHPERITLGDPARDKLPEIGFVTSSNWTKSDAHAIELVQAAGPSFLYAELDLAEDWQRQLVNGVAESERVGVRLDVGLIVPAGAELTAIAEVMQQFGPTVRNIAAFDADSHTTSARLADTARSAGIRVGGGSRANFAELNRATLPAGLARVIYPVNPQVHHRDERSIIGTVLAQPDTVRDARRIAEGRPLTVGPITLGPRHVALPGNRTKLPPDPRTSTPFAAAWTVGTLHGLRGADALIFFCTNGPGGLLDTATHPVHGLFAALAACERRQLRSVELDVKEWAAVAVVDGPTVVANLRSVHRAVELDHVRLEFGPYEVRVV